MPSFQASQQEVIVALIVTAGTTSAATGLTGTIIDKVIVLLAACVYTIQVVDLAPIHASYFLFKNGLHLIFELEDFDSITNF